MKKIVFVMPRLPFPAVSGRKNSLYNYCKILHEMGNQVTVVAFLEKDDNPNLKPDFIDELVILPKPTMKEKIVSLFLHSFLKKEWPLQVSLFWSKKASIIIDDLIVSHNPDIVIADMVRTTEYIRNKKCYRIADLDDMISLRYERQMKEDSKGINPYGAYINNMPKPLQKILLSSIIKRKVVLNEISLLKKYEKNIGKSFDKTIFVAQREADILNNILNEDKAIAVPIGVDYNFFSERVMKSLDNEFTYLSFLGQMNVAHNENAAVFFIQKVLPYIVEKKPNTKFLIIGGGVTEKLKNIQNDNVIFTGRVEDVRTYLQSSKIFVAPLLFGSGIKTKILEAMASGIPVVTTSIGAENIHAIVDKEWIVEDNLQNMASKILALMDNEKRCCEMGKNGQEYVKRNWTWNVAKEAFATIISEV